MTEKFEKSENNRFNICLVGKGKKWMNIRFSSEDCTALEYEHKHLFPGSH